MNRIDDFIRPRKNAWANIPLERIDLCDMPEEERRRYEGLCLWKRLSEQELNGRRALTARAALAIVRAQYGHSISYWYRWRERVCTEGIQGLSCRSRRPHRCANIRLWQDELIDRIRELKHDQYTTTYGAVKLKVVLDNEGYLATPSAATIGRILRMLREQKRIPSCVYRVSKPKTRRALHSYAIWYCSALHYAIPRVQIDVDYYVMNKTQVWYHFSAVHTATGYTWARAYSTLSAQCAAMFLSHIRDTCPPSIALTTVQVDGGAEFRSVFADLCQQYGIALIVNRPASPKQNAFVERAHRTFENEYYNVRTFPDYTCATINEGLIAFCHHYNYHRPHWGQGMRVPIKVAERLSEERASEYTTHTTRAP